MSFKVNRYATCVFLNLEKYATRLVLTAIQYLNNRYRRKIVFRDKQSKKCKIIFFLNFVIAVSHK